MTTALAPTRIDDKYTQEKGRVFISGTQALVRLPLMQRQADLAAGHNTAGYISGYRGSPLGTYDSELWKAKQFLKDGHVHFEPGVNEDLAATAVWGTQQTHTFPDAKYDGVFALWYGKGPGVDRAGDPIKHANIAGTAPLGGVLLVFGDDHAGKSSTISHQSEQALAANSVPVLYPATIQDYVDFGLKGWALSRFSGLWIGFKCVNETVENTASVDIDPARSTVVIPEDVKLPPEGVNYRVASNSELTPVADERRLVRYKLPLVHAFVRANGIDRVVIDGPTRRLGIVAAGKSYLDVLHALRLLGLDEAKARAIGLCLYKPGLIWPVEPQGLRQFASGLQEILFVEEKRSFLEEQSARILYDLAASARPRISGKTDPDGLPLLSADYVLQPQEIAQVLGARLLACGIEDAQIAEQVTAQITERMAGLRRLGKAQLTLVAADVARTPYFCAGCPHNSSTVLPEGSAAIGGIGCHGLGILMGRTLRSAHMGGEGLTWTGIAPFTGTKHVFQNLGDGTYSHSGLLAIHGAVTSKANITYKILFNDAVAMTGGQPVEGGGSLTVQAISRQTAAQGVTAIRVVTDEPDKYPKHSTTGDDFAPGVTVHHRDDLDAVQRELRDIAGTTVLIYDQTCAAEKRRRRKRGSFPDPAVRTLINTAVCEGCGDCSVKSNCVSVEPLETELGRKRQIDQASCNKDMSCVNGFCPSFVTVHGGKLKKPKAAPLSDADFAAIPEPLLPPIEGTYSALIAGVGGTGVVTIGAVLGMAAHLEGKGVSVFDMTGMAQKGGAVFSHLKIAARPEDVSTVAIGADEADLLLGCDLLVAGSRDALHSIRPQRTRTLVNTHLVPVGAFQRNPEMDFQAQRTIALVTEAAGSAYTHAMDVTALALAYTGNALSANMILVGCAYQLGALPLTRASIEQAIELNGVSVEQTKRSFAIGRLFIHAPALFAKTAERAQVPPSVPLETFIEHRTADLVAYQNAACAQRYTELVAKVAAAEARALGSGPAVTQRALTDAVARAYFKLLAYKDEYEVARLYTDGAFERQLHEQFEGDFELHFHLAPPMFSKRDPQTGHLRKRSFGPATFKLFKLLARLKGLRGTAFDVFGYTAERRMERRLITDYEATIGRLLSGLSADNHSQAVAIAQLPMEIKGYGHVKDRNIEQTRVREAHLKQAFSSATAPSNPEMKAA